MQANWSLILNVILLCVVVVAIRRLVIAQRQNAIQDTDSSRVDARPTPPTFNEGCDDIIAVRRVEATCPTFPLDESSDDIILETKLTPNFDSYDIEPEPILMTSSNPSGQTAALPETLMLFLLAKDNRQLAGYELLQTLLAAGLRYGEGEIFHRHQHANGQGPVLCSLAAATRTGVFDLQNIGAFSAKGLCLFMHTSGNAAIDGERFVIMLDTAKQLAEELDTHILDEHLKPFTDECLTRFKRVLNISDDIAFTAVA